MITQEHCANTWQTWAKCGCCLLVSCFYLFRLTLLKAWAYLGELSQSIMHSLFLTVILTVWVYMMCSQFEMTLVWSRCWKIYLRLMPTYGITGIWKDCVFKVPLHWFCLNIISPACSFVVAVWAGENAVYPPCPRKHFGFFSFCPSLFEDQDIHELH